MHTISDSEDTAGNETEKALLLSVKEDRIKKKMNSMTSESNKDSRIKTRVTCNVG